METRVGKTGMDENDITLLGSNFFVFFHTDLSLHICSWFCHSDKSGTCLCLQSSCYVLFTMSQTKVQTPSNIHINYIWLIKPPIITSGINKIRKWDINKLITMTRSSLNINFKWKVSILIGGLKCCYLGWVEMTHSCLI